MECFQRVRDSTMHTEFIITVTPHNAPNVHPIIIPVFTDEETEAQMGAYPRSHS